MNICNFQSPKSHLNFKIEERNLEIMHLINQESERPTHLIALTITRSHKRRIYTISYAIPFIIAILIYSHIPHNAEMRFCHLILMTAGEEETDQCAYPQDMN